MKTTLAHLPLTKQAEIERIVELVLAAGEPEMIILFGSHARGDWVDDFHVEGKNLFDYQSDYDIYVLTRLAKHVNRFTRNEQLRRRLHEIVPAPVSLIADTAKHFNASLERGRYFYVDVVNEGVVLFDSGRIKLTEPRELSREERLEEVSGDFENWFETAEDFLL
ncbi:MAG: nucleotidyltransferase domain-containing protein, partial [Proteobacteria bacterium]|nr:nucleotidyltransferase domain-containing protein [Pseudomonadota bacterium]